MRTLVLNGSPKRDASDTMHITRALIDGPIMMGCVGEYFSLLMYVLPQSYRGKRKPSRPYDGIIFVPYAHPTELLPWP